MTTSTPRGDRSRTSILVHRPRTFVAVATWLVVRRMATLAVCLSLALGLGAGCGGVKPGPDPVGGITIAVLLKQLSDEVQQTIDHASSSAAGLVTETGADVQNAIDTAAASLDDVLQQSIDQLDSAAAQRLQQLQSMVQLFTTDAYAQAENIQQTATSLVLTFPFANGQPQVRKWSPHFVNESDPVVIVIDGIFTQAANKGGEPTLTVSDHSYHIDDPVTPGGNTTQQLIFTLPAGALGASVTGVRPTAARLTVPYHSKILKTDQTATYTLRFGVLPAHAGSVVLRHVLHSKRHEEQPMRTDKVQQGCGNQDIDLNYYTTDFDHTAGWRIKPGSYRWVVDDYAKWSGPDREGDLWSHRRTNADNLIKMGERVTTVGSNTFRHSGCLWFHLEWVIQRDVNDAVWVDEPPITVDWGRQIVLQELKAKEWKIFWQPFQGPSQEIDGPYRSDWLTVTIGPDSATLKSLEAGQVKF